MKKTFYVLVLAIISFTSSAQREEGEEKRGFNKENLFTGGSITASFANSTTVLGASPVLGYNITNWLDAGVVLNFTYFVDRHFIGDDKFKQTVFGPGVFAKIYPLKFLFIQAQGEHNFSRQRLIYDDGSPSQKYKASAFSFLVGGGYCSGRESKGSTFYYISLLFDIAKDKNSPYVEQLSSGNVNILPILRAGMQISLKGLFK